MKKTIKKKWVAALRSGKYRKGKGVLKTPDGRYCCLGVLVDLYRKEKGLTFKEVTRDNHLVLPNQVQRWSGTPDSNPVVVDGQKMVECLSQINDHTGTSFKGIASLIDKSL